MASATDEIADDHPGSLQSDGTSRDGDNRQGGIAADHLKSFIERIERLEEEKAAIANDITEVYAEAKGTGFDVKIMRQLVRLRKMEANDRSEQSELLDIYMRAVGMVV